MARPLRIEYPGAIYHLLSRGDRREAIFKSDSDRELFLGLVARTCRRTGWQIHAYCLMGNHFHLVVETPRPNLSAGMQWLLGSYTQQFNRRHRLCGHLFGGRYNHWRRCLGSEAYARANATGRFALGSDAAVRNHPQPGSYLSGHFP